MRVHRIRASTLTLAIAALAALAAFATSTPALARHARAHNHVRPHAFASCAGLVGYASAHFAVTHGVPETPVRALSEPTAIGGTPAPRALVAPAGAEATSGAGSAYSTTNNQEAGVDEPDIVKTDGATIFAVEQGTLYAIDVADSSVRLAGSLPLGMSGFGAQLLLSGKRLLVISGGGGPPLGLVRALPPAATPASVAARAGTRPRGVGVATAPMRRALPPGGHFFPSPYFYPARTTVTEVDVTNPTAMAVARTLKVDGTFVDARQNGATARLVIASAPAALADPPLRARASGWIPEREFHSFITGHHSRRPLARCSAIDRPAQFSGLGMLSILTINLDRGLYAVNSTSLMADAQVVYGSQRNLYVATQRWIDPSTAGAALPASQETVIDQLDAGQRETTTLVASGTVPGYVLNQFSLSEAGGFLRVASTSAPIWWGSSTPQASQSYVTVLADRAGSLVPVGQVAGLGAGQRIYSVRFIGDTAYVVTFRSVDPLYVVDVSSPTAPRVAGSLELAGYSAYLHPVGDGLLLGVGQAVGAGNEPAGTQLELFDTSDAAGPKLLARTQLGEGSSSSVQYDHHAFLFWPPTALAVLPVSIYTPSPPMSLTTAAPLVASTGFTGAIGFHVDRSGITEAGRVAHDPIAGYSPPIDRSLVVGPRLFTLSSEGLMASDLGTLARLGFVAFPVSSAGRGGGTVRPAGG